MDQQEVEARVAELRGKKPWTEAEARLVLEACARSGGSVTRFARRMNLAPCRLLWWKGRFRRETGTPPVFVPLVVREAAAERRDCTAVLVRGATRVELRGLSKESAAWAAELLRLLEAERP
jgi:hypothetical protein